MLHMLLNDEGFDQLHLKVWSRTLLWEYALRLEARPELLERVSTASDAR